MVFSFLLLVCVNFVLLRVFYKTIFQKQKKQQLVSGIISITELEKEVKAVLDVLGLLSNLTYSEVQPELLYY